MVTQAPRRSNAPYRARNRNGHPHARGNGVHVRRNGRPMTRRTGRLHACRSGGGLFPATVLGTSEARAHVTRLRCGTLQSIGMWTQTERDLRARNDCGHVTGKLTGPVEGERLIYNELHQGLLQGTRLIRKKPNRPSSQWLQACEIAGYETGRF
jgi:hypothetical protein